MTAALIKAAERLDESITYDNSGTGGRGGNGGLISRDTMRKTDEQRVAIHQAREAEAALSVRIEALEAMLRETLDKGLIYWEPQTARGAVAKADMKARIAALLFSEADHGR
jgi:hypothetical protein